MIERRQLHHELQRPRVDGDGIERRREEKQRNQDGQDEVEILPGADKRRGRGSDRGEGEADEHRPRESEQRPWRDDEAERSHDNDEAEGIERPANQCPGDLAERDISDPERCRDHGIVKLDVLQLEKEIERRFVDRTVHCRRCHHRWCDKHRVAERMPVDDDAGGNEGANPEADREQVEQRLDKTRNEEQPPAPIKERIPFHEASGAVGRRDLERSAPGQHRDHVSSLRCRVIRAATMPADA